MNFTKTMFAVALGSVGIMGAMSAHAASLTDGSVLSITAGVAELDSYGNIANVTSGSFFGMDNDGNAKIAGTEKVPLAMGTDGLVIGTTTTAGASHGGAPAAEDTNSITAPWNFFGNTGSDYLTVAVTGGTEGLDLSGWTVTWAGIPAIAMGAGAWQPGNCAAIGCSGITFTDGVADFQWDGTDGGAYVLNYAGTVPDGDPSGFGNVKYYLHLEGTVDLAAPVPEAETYAMMLAGLGLVGMMVRRRRNMV